MGPTAPTASGSGRRGEHPRSARRTLILTVTRRCDLRCAYCPTAKDGWPSLTPDDARAAIDLFADRYGGGDVKVFGGEPLLVPEVVRAALDHADQRPEIERVYLSTNGLGLDAGWFETLARSDKTILTVSMDGAPEDHRRFRRPLGGVADAYDHLTTLLPTLRSTPRVVITQTIPPASAARAAANFEHLLGLGLRRFNLLPGYFVPWRADQLRALRTSFAAIGARIAGLWEDGEQLYLRNLFTWAPTPFFNAGLVVDADRSIHSSNVVLSGALESLGERTRLGTLDAPPDLHTLDAAAASTWALLQRELPPRIVASTEAADAALSELVEGLYPRWARWRQRRRATASHAAAS